MSTSKPPLVERINRKLTGFGPTIITDEDFAPIFRKSKHSIARETFPIPRLIPFLFCKVLGYPPGDRFDKMHWSVVFEYHGAKCVITHEKFGLRLYYKDDANVSFDDVIGRINGAIRLLERELLEPAAAAALEADNVVVVNHFSSLDNRYRFYRELAQKRTQASSLVVEDELHLMLANLLKTETGSDLELGYHTLSMMDAYFSRLEHFMVFALGFSAIDPNVEHLSSFVGADWGKKFGRVFATDANKAAKHFYDRLVALKEAFRNPMSHGAFEKGGASFYFDHPGIGVIPVALLNVTKTLHFSFRLGKPATLNDAVSLFDELDEWIKKTAHAKAWLFATSGFGLPFDAEALAHLNRLSIEDLDEWLQRQHEIDDAYRNVDY